ncbi:hypothetical protein [Sedimentitalea arenosa]|jgi:hypothetical protein|uniref:Uncharacterized protein n=1 Tax=Sedimentitalea arenosa TaxID=2798803 RepID=A0A8J7IM39_9RHOB|nr:hypothetical protein [Arenibacterium arenosum]MBJ6373158.1 hypothetical protein [Arenibacterium arenosum]
MFGVVLWSDGQDNKAVIWCEDHGDLAFYRQEENEASVALDAGDWVEFDMSMDHNLRFVHNPRLVAEGVFPELPEALESAAPRKAAASGQAQRGSAEIIPFALARGRRDVQRAEVAQKSAL